jgi:hypothetical protein
MQEERRKDKGVALCICPDVVEEKMVQEEEEELDLRQRFVLQRELLKV